MVSRGGYDAITRIACPSILVCKSLLLELRVSRLAPESGQPHLKRALCSSGIKHASLGSSALGVGNECVSECEHGFHVTSITWNRLSQQQIPYLNCALK